MYVDKFIIVVSNRTHSGLPKKVTFEPFEKEINQYKDKADIVYFDPYISKFKDCKIIMEGEKELTKKLLESSDIVIITTAHTNIDYKFVVDNAKIVFDTKNVTKEINKKDNVYVL